MEAIYVSNILLAITHGNFPVWLLCVICEIVLLMLAFPRHFQLIFQLYGKLLWIRYYYYRYSPYTGMQNDSKRSGQSDPLPGANLTQFVGFCPPMNTVYVITRDWKSGVKRVMSPWWECVGLATWGSSSKLTVIHGPVCWICALKMPWGRYLKFFRMGKGGLMWSFVTCVSCACICMTQGYRL